MSKKQRIRKYGEVFTPEWIVKDMCDMLENENENAFNISSTFLEPTCGDGAFVIEILKRKFEKCKSNNDYTQAIKSVYGMEIQADNVRKTIERVIKLCRDYFQPTKEQIALIQDHIIQCDSLKIMKMIAEMNCEKKALSNADRIRQMTDDELSVFLGGIADNCSYNACDNCPMYGACVDVPLSRDKWLKQEVSEDAGTD